MDFFVNFIFIFLKILILLVPLLLVVAYFTLLERKVIGYMQDRIGPNRVGPYGLLQPIADALKLFFKEGIIPSKSDAYLFYIAPALVLIPSLAAWAVIPLGNNFVISDINIGLLYILALTSAGVYGVIIGGWSSNSKYAFFGALRSVAQTVSYEIGMGFSIVGVLMVSGSMNLKEIVVSQHGGIFNWFWIPLFPLLIVYFVSVVAETNRAPFDVVEGESEIVAGFHVEYSGMSFAIFFLAEYANIILVSSLTTLLFFGGWLSPFESFDILDNKLSWVPGILWFALKTGFFMILFLWFRATFPRYRYDQIMRLGWKIFIPVTLIWIFVLGFFLKLDVIF